MAKKQQRVFALVMALLFFVTTVGFTAVIIWQVVTKDDEQQSTQEEKTLSELSQGNSSAGQKLPNYTPQADVTQLEVIDLKEGTGEAVQPGDRVTVHYTGALASDGTIFESSLDIGQPITFGLDQVIAGWGQGLPGMKVGGERRLIIPASLAYGADSPDESIPPNSALVFDIKLLAINPQQ